MAPRPKQRDCLTQPDDPSIRYIALTKGKVAIVDAIDFAWASRFNWQAQQKQTGIWYAQRSCRKNGKQSIAMLHREIMGNPAGVLIDHRDGDGLNNRRSNLRSATKAQNAFNAKRHKDNSSGMKGVHFNARLNRWCARISRQGKNTHLGVFDTPQLAHAAYCEKAKEVHGEFARFG